MKSPFRWYLIGACALACIAIGQPTLAATRVAATVGAPSKLESNVKLTIVSGNNQVFTYQQPGTPCPYTNCNWPSMPYTFSALAVKLTTLGGLPIPYASIVFTFHLPSGPWVCQFKPSGPLTGTISITTDRLGVATLNQMRGNALNVWCNYKLKDQPCGGDVVGHPGQLITVAAAYGDNLVVSTTFNLTMVYLNPPGIPANPPGGGFSGSGGGQPPP